jgi:hypothetical protein
VPTFKAFHGGKVLKQWSGADAAGLASAIADLAAKP